MLHNDQSGSELRDTLDLNAQSFEYQRPASLESYGLVVGKQLNYNVKLHLGKPLQNILRRYLLKLEL